MWIYTFTKLGNLTAYILAKQNMNLQKSLKYNLPYIINDTPPNSERKYSFYTLVDYVSI